MTDRTARAPVATTSTDAEPVDPARSEPAAVATAPGARARPMPGRADVRYVISSRADGTLSSSVGEGDWLLSRRRLAAALGARGSLAFMRQVHGADVALISDEAPAVAPEVDALVTSEADRPLAVLVADCVPVLLAAGDAVGVVHAGRKGVELGIVDVAVRTLLERAQRDPSVACAVIGPAIGPCCYEVPPDMTATVEAKVPGTSSTTTWGTPSLDLPGAVGRQLAAAGVARVERDGGCTLCAHDRWFSHRASTGPAGSAPGRQAAAIVRLGAAS